MKRIFQFLSVVMLLMALNYTIAAAEPEKFIPEKTTAILRFDLPRLLEMEWFNQLIKKHPQAAEVMDMLGKLQQRENITVNDIINGQLWAAVTGENRQNGRVYLFASTLLPENRFSELFQRGMLSTYHDLRIQTINGRMFYVYNPGSGKKAMALTYLTPDTIMIGDWHDGLANDVQLCLKGGSPLVGFIDRKAMFAFIIANKQNVPQFQGIERAGITLDLLGKNTIDAVKLQIKLTCKDQQAAAASSMQLQVLLPAMIQAVFTNDPELAAIMIKPLKLKANANEVQLDYQQNTGELEKAVKYLKKPENQVLLKSLIPGMQNSL